MANNVDPFNPEHWSRSTQAYLRKSLVATQVASTREEAMLRDGDTVHRPFKSRFVASDYTKNTDVTATDITSTDETLIVNKSKIVRFDFDPVEQKQSKYDIFKSYAPEASYTIRDEIDRAVFAHVTSGSYTIDEGNFGGTAAGPIDLDTYAPKKVWGLGKGTLLNNFVETDKPIVTVIDSLMANNIQQDFITDGFNSADTTLKNGYGGPVLGMRTYISNNLPSAVSLGIATTPTAADTVTIKGVVFTFVASPAAAGDVDIGVSAATSVDNLVAAINAGAGAGSTYIELSVANRQKLSRQGVVATDNTTAIGLAANGRINGAETFTDASDGFGEETIYSPVMQQGAIDLVVQLKPSSQVNKAVKNLGHTVLVHTLFGTKLFQEGADRLLYMPIRANAATV